MSPLGGPAGAKRLRRTVLPSGESEINFAQGGLGRHRATSSPVANWMSTTSLEEQSSDPPALDRTTAHRPARRNVPLPHPTAPRPRPLAGSETRGQRPSVGRKIEGGRRCVSPDLAQVIRP